MRIYKNVLTVLVVLISTFATNAQTEKGKLLLGGDSQLDLSFSSYRLKSNNGKSDPIKSVSYGFAPQVGVFILDGFVVGGELPFSYSSYKSSNGDKDIYKSVRVAPFTRYYFGSNKIKPYLHGNIGFGSRIGTYENEGDEIYRTTYGLFGYKVEGGIAVFLNDKVAIDIGLGYNSESLKSKEDNPNNSREIRKWMALDLGVSVIL